MPADFADDTDVAFASHHWPTWGIDNIVRFLREQRDLYAFLHDPTLRLMNQGYVRSEIAEMFEMPPALDRVFAEIVGLTDEPDQRFTIVVP